MIRDGDGGRLRQEREGSPGSAVEGVGSAAHGAVDANKGRGEAVHAAEGGGAEDLGDESSHPPSRTAQRLPASQRYTGAGCVWAERRRADVRLTQ